MRQAAGLPSLTYWLMQNPKNLPFQWVLRHRSEERKDQLVTRVPGGGSIPSGQLTPYGNSLLMFSKMKTTRVQAASDSLKDGKGRGPRRGPRRPCSQSSNSTGAADTRAAGGSM